MNVKLPDALKEFIDRQVETGNYATSDAFVAELVQTEADLFRRVERGEPLPLDEHFPRRLEALLDEAEKSGDYISVSREDFDSMEREALDSRQHSKSS